MSCVVYAQGFLPPGEKAILDEYYLATDGEARIIGIATNYTDAEILDLSVRVPDLVTNEYPELDTDKTDDLTSDMTAYWKGFASAGQPTSPMTLADTGTWYTVAGYQENCTASNVVVDTVAGTFQNSVAGTYDISIHGDLLGNTNIEYDIAVFTNNALSTIQCETHIVETNEIENAFARGFIHLPLNTTVRAKVMANVTNSVTSLVNFGINMNRIGD